jgi:WD40 repeat protein/serine/threonine protein kinase
LAQTVGDETAAAIDSHVESCRTCQGILDKITEQELPFPPDRGHRPDAALLANIRVSPVPASQTVVAGGRSNDPYTGSVPNFPGYVISKVLGRGGMGVVYAATQMGLNREVALKTITSGALAGPGELTRFRIEAEAAARLQHPNVVQVYEVGEQDGVPFLALELIEGGCLSEHLIDLRLSDKQAAHLVQILAKAVQHAHQRGIIHRDLKPANVLLQWCPENRDSDQVPSSGEVGLLLPRRDLTPEYCIPKITDFGLAKFTRSHQAETVFGSILGTPSYMAPEQARGRTSDLSTAVDIYTLGSILYELLTGRPPHRGETAGETLYQVLNDTPRPPSLDRPTLSKDLEAICLKCLEREPRNRYPSAKDLAEDLRRFEADEPVQARSISPWARFRKFARRKPTTAALGLVVSLVAVATVAGTVWYQSRLESWLRQVSDERDHARTARVDADARRTEAELQRDHAQENLYLAEIPLAQRAWDSAHVERLSEILTAYIPTERAPRDLRNLEWDYLNGLAHADRKTLVGHEDLVTSVAYSPDGTRIASASADGSIRIWDSQSGRENGRPLRKHKDRVTSVAFDPDGRRLISTGADKSVYLWDLRTGEFIRSFEGHGNWVYHAAFSADGKRLATASTDRTIRLWSVDTGLESGRLLGHTKQVTFVAFSPDQQTLASAGADKTIRLWDLNKSVESKVLEGHTGYVYSVLFSPDGASLASASFDKTTRIWDVGNGLEKHRLEGHTGQVRGLAFSRDGTRLASASYDQTVRIWDARSGRPLLCLKGHHGRVLAVAFHPDGNSIASGGDDHTVKLWEATRYQDYSPIQNHDGAAVNALAVRSDSRLVASGGSDGTVRLWDCVTERPMTPIGASGSAIYSLAFSPNRPWLAIGSADKNVILWDLENSRPIHTLAGHSGRVSGVAFSPNGGKLASVSYDGRLRIWDVRTGEKLHDLSAHAGRATCTQFNADGTLVATAGEDRLVRLWNVDTGREVRTLEEHLGWVYCLAFSPNGDRLASGVDDGSIRLWETKDWTIIRSLDGHAGQVGDLVFSPDGQRLLTTGYADKTVKVWELKRGHELISLNHPGSVHSVAIRSDGRGFVSAGEFAEVRYWKTVRLSRPE